MTPDPFDRTCRYLLRQTAEPLLGWLLGSAFDFVQWLDTRRLPWPGQPERACDTVTHVRDLKRGGVPWAVVVEFQTEPDADMLGRLLEYLGKLRLDARPTPHPGDRFKVAAVVVYLTGTTSCAEEMEWPEAGLGTAVIPKEVHLAKLRAADILDAAERGDAPRVAVAWVPLMQGREEPGIIQRWLQVAGQEPDARRRADLGLALTFAELAGCRHVWKDALKEWNMRESITIKEWQREARVEGQVAFLVRVLKKKFGKVPDEVANAIASETDLDKLDAWSDVAALVGALEDFRQQTGL
jgi:hypothetical protein